MSIKHKLKKPLTVRVVKDATRPLVVRVTQQNIIDGIPGDSSKCVFACSLRDHFGDTIETMDFGHNIIKIYTPGMCTRYRTPNGVRPALREFDITGKFNLPVGEYTLRPMLSALRAVGLAKAAKKRPEVAGVSRKRSGTFYARPVPPRNMNFDAFVY